MRRTPNGFRSSASAARTVDVPATIAAARDQNPDALDQLFRHFYPRVQRMVHRSLATDLRVSRPWLAARFSTGDVVQDVFRNVLLDLEAFAGTNEAAFTSYLVAVVKHRIVDAIRFHEAGRRDGRRGGPAPLPSDAVTEADDPLHQAIDGDIRDTFERALATFPAREQHLLRARLECSSTFDELTAQLGYTSESKTRRTFYAAQARLAMLMDEG